MPDRFRDIITKAKSVRPDAALIRLLAQEIKNQGRKIPDPNVIPEFVPPPEQTTEEQLAGATAVPAGFLGIRQPEIDPNTGRVFYRDAGQITGADVGETVSALLPGIGGTLGAAATSGIASPVAAPAGFLTGKAAGSFAQQELQSNFPKLFGKPRSSLLSEVIVPGLTTGSNATDAFLEDLVFDVPGAVFNLAARFPTKAAKSLAKEAGEEAVEGFRVLSELDAANPVRSDGRRIEVIPDTTVGSGAPGGLARNLEDILKREELQKIRTEGLRRINNAVELLTDLPRVIKKSPHSIAVKATEGMNEVREALGIRELAAFNKFKSTLGTEEFFEVGKTKVTPAHISFADDSFESAATQIPGSKAYTRKRKPTIIKGPIDLGGLQPQLQARLEQVNRELGLANGTVENAAGAEVLADTGEGVLSILNANPKLARLRKMFQDLTTPKQKFTGPNTPPIEGFITPHSEIKKLRTLLGKNIGKEIDAIEGQELGLAKLLGGAINNSLNPKQRAALKTANDITKEIAATFPRKLKNTVQKLNVKGKVADTPESVIEKGLKNTTEAGRLTAAAGGDLEPLQQGVVKNLYEKAGIGENFDPERMLNAIDRLEAEKGLMSTAFTPRQVANLRSVMKFASQHLPPATGTGAGNTLQFLKNRIAIYGSAATLGAITGGKVLQAITTPVVAAGAVVGITFAAEQFTTKVLMNNHSAFLAKQLIKAPAGSGAATPLIRKLMDLRALQGLRVSVIILDKETGQPRELLLDDASFNSKNNPVPSEVDLDALLKKQGLIN